MSSRGSAAAAGAAALLGFLSVASQAILARELLVVFHGSELALGLVLAVWLVLGGAGSALAARALGGRRPAPQALAAVVAAAALSLPAGVLAARWAAAFLHLAPGTVPGVRDGALAALALLAAPAAAGGAWFAVAAAIGRDARGPGRAYAWESAGGLAGGAAVAFAFAAGTADAFTLAAAVATATLTAAAWLVARGGGAHARVLAAGLAALALPVALAGPLGGLAARSQAARWPGLELLATRDGRHGNAALARVAGQVTLFANGEPAFSFPDPESAEAAAHLPLLAAPRVSRVLLTAEALGGALAEALKHPVTAVDVVVSDPDLLPLLLPQLPSALAAALEDPRVGLRHGDLRAWVAANPGAYDAVLLGSLEPASALANRLATREFFALVRASLRPGGVAALSLSSGPNYLGPELRLRNASVARALAASFPRVEVLRPNPLMLLASDAPEPLADPGRIAARLAERGIATSTLAPEVIPALLDPARAERAGHELRETRAAANRDAAPAAYLYHARYREAAADPPAAAWLAALDGRGRWAVFALPLLVALASVAPGGGAARRRTALAVAAAVTGCGGMALQFLLFFVYQTARGLLYTGLGVLSAIFMGGLAAGGALALLLHRRGIPLPRLLGATQGALVPLPALAGAAFAGALAAGSGALPLVADLLAGAVSAGCGLCGGLAFALLTLSDPRGEGGSGGWYYALDLGGAAAGALLASIWLLPLLGLPATLAFLALLQAAATTALWRAGAISLR